MLRKVAKDPQEANPSFERDPCCKISPLDTQPTQLCPPGIQFYLPSLSEKGCLTIARDLPKNSLPFQHNPRAARKRQYGARCVPNPREHLYHGMRTLNNAQTKMLLTDLGRAPKILAMQEDVKVGSVVFWGSHKVLQSGHQLPCRWQHISGDQREAIHYHPHYTTCRR